jgi:hypothetical protein
MAKNKTIQMEEYDPNKPSSKLQEKPKTETKKPEKEKPVDEDNDIYDIIEGLPTLGKLYSEGTVIKARPLKVSEVKMLAGMTEDTANNIVNQILERTIRGIDIEDIYTADKMYIMFWLRANTYKESGYEVSFECNECKKTSQYKFELDVLNVKQLTDDDAKTLKKEFKLPNGDKIKFKLLTVKDENDNEKFLKQNKTALMNFEDEMVSICRMIDTINGEKKGMIDKYMYLSEQLLPTDYAYLESYLENASVGLEPTISVKCTKCGGEADVLLPFRPDFFLPKVRV